MKNRLLSILFMCFFILCLFPHALLAASNAKPKNYLPKPKILLDLRSEYASFFEKWRDKKQIEPPNFQRGENGEVVLDFGGQDMLATADSGKTWHTYNGKRLWPTGSFEIIIINDERIALSGGQSLRRSQDQGKTWSHVEKIPPATHDRYPILRGPCVFSAAVTKNNRILIPEDYLTGREGPDLDVLFVNMSDDGGRSWTRSHIIEPPSLLPKGPGQLEGFGEPAVVELPNGHIWMVFRTSYGELWQCESTDGGMTWSTPCSTGLASPISNVKAMRIPGSDSTLLVWNLAKPGPSRSFDANPGAYRPRAPLVFSVSHDGCKTWSCPTIIMESTGIYPLLHFTDNELFILFLSQPKSEIGEGAEYGLTVAVYNKQDLLNLPSWTKERIGPYIDAGLVAHWRSYFIPEPVTNTTKPEAIKK